jgi:hypothetical protein
MITDEKVMAFQSQGFFWTGTFLHCVLNFGDYDEAFLVLKSICFLLGSCRRLEYLSNGS